MLSWWLRAAFSILIWPGLLAGALFGWFLLWVSRKLIARFQGRRGPMFFQPFFDFWKLIGKQTIIPKGANPFIFYALPVISVLSAVLALALLPFPGQSAFSFEGDLILFIYLLEVPAIMDILAGYATRSVYAQIGAAREAVMILAYNLPFLSALIALALKVKTFQLGNIASSPISAATIVAAVTLLLALLAQLKVNPFSIPNAEQEIVAGIHVEYNGVPLALFELAHALEASALVGLISSLFLGTVGSVALKLLLIVAISLVLIFLINIISAGTARLKVQHAFKFYWTWGIAASVIVFAVALLL